MEGAREDLNHMRHPGGSWAQDAHGSQPMVFHLCHLAPPTPVSGHACLPEMFVWLIRTTNREKKHLTNASFP